MDKYIQVLVLVLRAVTVVGIAKISWCTGFLKKMGIFFFKFVKNASFFSKINSQTIKNFAKNCAKWWQPCLCWLRLGLWFCWCWG